MYNILMNQPQILRIEHVSMQIADTASQYHILDAANYLCYSDNGMVMAHNAYGKIRNAMLRTEDSELFLELEIDRSNTPGGTIHQLLTVIDTMARLLSVGQLSLPTNYGKYAEAVYDEDAHYQHDVEQEEKLERMRELQMA